MKYVRALADGQWVEVPIPIYRPADAQVDPHAPEPPKLVRTLVMARENGRWKVNHPHEGVDVFPGLVVSFVDINDAEFFLNFPQRVRASRVVVEAGQIVVFHEDADAQHFITQGLAERVSKSEAKALLAASAPKPDNVLQIQTPAKAGKRAAR